MHMRDNVVCLVCMCHVYTRGMNYYYTPVCKQSCAWRVSSCESASISVKTFLQLIPWNLLRRVLALIEIFTLV